MMKALEIDADTLSLVAQLLTAQERDVISVIDGEVVGPEAVINKIAAADLTELRKESLIAYAAAKRYAVETGGITLNGAAIATDRQTQQMVNGAFNMAQQNPEFTTMWKGANGSFTQMNAETIIAIAQAIGAHVAACFAAEAAAVSKINAGTYTTREHVDSALVV